MQNILSKYSILYLTNQTNRSAHKDYFSNPKGVTWEAVLNVQDWSTVPPSPLYTYTFKIRFLGPHFCWRRSPLGPHFTQNWVPILK